MTESSDLMTLAFGVARHAAARQALVARNMANADTPGYRAQDIADFADSYDGTGLGLRATRPGHLADTADGAAAFDARAVGGGRAPNGNDVSLESEMMRGAAARREHDLALTVYRNSLDILRASLGRR